MEKLHQELIEFCNRKGLEVREAAYLLGLFTKHYAALSQPAVISTFCRCEKPDWCMENNVCGVCNKDIKVKRQNYL